MINTLSTLSTLHKLYLYTKKGIVSVWGLGRSKFSKSLFWGLGRSKRGDDHFSHLSQVESRVASQTRALDKLEKLEWEEVTATSKSAEEEGQPPCLLRLASTVSSQDS